MNYKHLLSEAQKRGLTNETKMWQSVALIGEGLDLLEDNHPEMYWKLMRKQHGIIYDCHYTEEFARHDIDKMMSIDRNGLTQRGEHWTKDEVLEATSGKSFPSGVTDCDKWVAFNAMWHDMHRKFDDEQILDIAYLFYFDDEDWKKPGSKVWEYISLNAE